MELVMNERSSKLVKTFVVENESYKVNVNLTVAEGKIDILNGNVLPLEVEEGRYVEGARFNAYKRNDKWFTDINGASNEEHDAISDLCVAIVEKVVAEYDKAE